MKIERSPMKHLFALCIALLVFSDVLLAGPLQDLKKAIDSKTLKHVEIKYTGSLGRGEIFDVRDGKGTINNSEYSKLTNIKISMDEIFLKVEYTESGTRISFYFQVSKIALVRTYKSDRDDNLWILIDNL